MVPVPLPNVLPHLRLLDHEISSRALPSEILAHVFSFGSCTYDHERRAPKDIQDSTTFPIVASHVCRYWRYIALSNARLWSTILLTFHDLDNLYDSMTSSHPCQQSLPKFLSPAWCKRATTFLTRSRSRPLYLHLDLRDPLWDFQRQDSSHGFHWSLMQPVLDVLIPYVSRWRHVSLISDTYEPIYAFMNRCHVHSAPILRSIELSRCNAYFVMPGEIFTPPILGRGLPLFESIPPLLQDIELAGVHLDWDLLVDAASSPMLSSLRTLELKYHAQNVLPSISTFTTFLSNNSHLRKLCISGWGVHSITALDTLEFASFIKLPELEEFEFSWVHGEFASRFLRLFDWSICGTMLRRLHLEDVRNGLDPMGVWMYDESDPQTHNYYDGVELRRGSDLVLTFFSAADPPNAFQNIEFIALKNVVCSPDHLQAFLYAMTGTRRLKLDGMDLLSIARVFDSLTKSSHESDVGSTNESVAFEHPCPLLEHLSLLNMHSSQDDAAAFDPSSPSQEFFFESLIEDTAKTSYSGGLDTDLYGSTINFDFEIPSIDFTHFLRAVKAQASFDSSDIPTFPVPVAALDIPNSISLNGCLPDSLIQTLFSEAEEIDAGTEMAAHANLPQAENADNDYVEGFSFSSCSSSSSIA